MDERMIEKLQDKEEELLRKAAYDLAIEHDIDAQVEYIVSMINLIGKQRKLDFPEVERIINALFNHCDCYDLESVVEDLL